MIPGTATYDDVNNSDGILAWSRLKRPLLSPSSLYQTSEYPGIDRNSSAIKMSTRNILCRICNTTDCHTILSYDIVIRDCHTRLSYVENKLNI